MPVTNTWRLRPSLAGAAALALIAALQALAAPVRADTAGAVWVPLAPAGAQVKGPVVLVPFAESPFAQTLHLPEPGSSPMPWVPEYLSPGLAPVAPAAPDTAARRLRNLPRRDDFGLVGAGQDLTGQARAGERAGEAPAAPGFTLSDVLRDVQWRRDTADRMRAQPGFRLPY